MDKKRMWLWIIAALVIVGAALLFIFTPKPSVAPAPIAPSGPTAQYAPAGQLVDGFPKNLILDAGPDFSTSYTIAYDGNNQYTAQWNSSSSLGTVLFDYINYFKNSGWDVSLNPVTDKNVRALGGVLGTTSALVNITAQGAGSQITVTYVKK